MFLRSMRFKLCVAMLMCMLLVVNMPAVMLNSARAAAGPALAQKFQVVGATLKADSFENNGPCPRTVNFNGYIKANGPGTVTYKLIRSDGASGPVRTLDFREAGSQPVNTTWTLGGPGLPRFEGWEAIKILSPNDLESSHETGAFVLNCTQGAEKNPAPDTPQDVPDKNPQQNTNEQPKGINIPTADGASVQLDRRFYAAGNALNATVTIKPAPANKENMLLFVASPDTKDVETVSLIPKADGESFVTDKPLQIVSSQAGAQKQDGQLAAAPNEILVAMFYYNEAKPSQANKGKGPSLVADFGIMEDKNFQKAQVKVMPEIAMTDDEKQVPQGGKRIGTVAMREGGMVQIPVDELIFYPKDGEQLKQFMEESGGQIISSIDTTKEQAQPLTHVPAQGNSQMGHSAYLLKVNPAQGDLEHLPQLRALFGEKETLYGSSEDVLRMFSLAMLYELKGYAVGVNPRLQYMGGPVTGDSSSINAISNTSSLTHSNLALFNDQVFGVPQAWAFLALWDKDRTRIPVAFLDQGFAPNFDFRGFSGGSIPQCDLEGTGPLMDIRCAPGAAAAPPTVGNSFFGDPSWHGNGVVTTAGGVLNNGWGSAGTGGQVLTPMLYKTGLRSYAFELGRGIRKATDDGATVINISAGYPCRVVSNVAGITGGIDVCSAGTWAAVCAVLSVALHTAAALTCAIPIVGPFICPAGLAVATAVTVACSAWAVSVPVLTRGLLQDGVDYARARGVTVVSISGNQVVNTGVTPLPELCSIISCTTQDVSDWQVIPGVLPGVICAGAADDRAPFANNQFFGSRVDVWAPIGDTFFAPPTTARDDGPTTHGPNTGFNGTSAAAPYVAGVIAMMQAVNPQLNPLMVPPDQRPAIPGRILTLLRSTATPASALPMNPSNPEVARRRNLINAFSAVRAAAGATVPDVSALRYDSSLSFDGTDDPARIFDTPATAREVRLSSASDQTHTILTIPRDEGPGGSDYTGHDFYKLVMPSASGIYEGRFRLKFPTGFGDLVVRAGGLPLTPTTRRTAGVEQILEFATPPVLYRSDFIIEVGGIIGPDAIRTDNVYKLEFSPALRISDAPMADQFDDPARNPFRMPDNNSAERAVPLGTGGFGWQDAGGTEGSKEIVINGLNFSHPSGNDRDWFSLQAPDTYRAHRCGDCPASLIISAAMGVTIDVQSADGRSIRSAANSPLSLSCNEYDGRFPLKFVLSSNGRPINYDLHVSWEQPDATTCSIWHLAGDLTHIEWLGDFRIIDPLWDPTPDDARVRQMDAAGRVTQPQYYMIRWGGVDTFSLRGRIERGESLALQLMDAQGKTLAQAATTDLLQQFPQSVKHVDDGEFTALNLEAKQLPAGVYLLSVSHRHPQSTLEVALKGNNVMTNKTPAPFKPSSQPPNLKRPN
jgi:hypothetical protein